MKFDDYLNDTSAWHNPYQTVFNIDSNYEGLNNHPRETLDFMTSNEVFYKRKKLTG